jgi:anti-sigma factor RsiW
MILIGALVSAVAAFLASSGYYAAATPIERRALGDTAIDRGRPQPWKVLAELCRTTVVAAVFAWLANRSGLEHLPGGLALAGLLWLAFPAVLLSGSILWERVPSVTAAMHAGDWLVKLLLIAVIVGLLH